MARPLFLAILLLPATARRSALEPEVERDSPSDPGAAIMAWNASVEGEVAAEIEAVREAERLASSYLQSQGVKYRWTQLVGLGLYTLPQGILIDKGYYTGIRKELQEHEGTRDRNMEDAVERVRVMKQMLEVAHASKMYSRAADVLKVFVAPEFFFRGPRGAYDMRSLDGCLPMQGENTVDAQEKVCNAAIVKIFVELQSFVIEERWADWLFVFGTVVASEGKSFYNFAPVMRGGRGGAGRHHVVTKTFVSDLDFLDKSNSCVGPDCVFFPPGQDKMYTPFSDSQKKKLKEMGFIMAGYNDFMMDGIHFGVEICLDHAKAVLPKKMRAAKSDIDVQVITSAGMFILAAYTRKHGPVYMQDGGTSARTSYLCQDCRSQDDGTGGGDYGDGVIHSSNKGQFVLDYLYDVRELKLEGKEVSTLRNESLFYSQLGFATEGTGGAGDPRFAEEVVGKVFALDNYHPTLNIGPAFALPLTYKYQ